MSRWSNTLDKFVRGDDVTPVASAVRTTSSDSGWLNCEEYQSLVLDLAITARSGTTPTLDVIVETASDNVGTNTVTVDSAYAQQNNTGTVHKIFRGLDKFYRVRWTVGGTTPSFTFSVAGQAK